MTDFTSQIDDIFYKEAYDALSAEDQAKVQTFAEVVLVRHFVFEDAFKETDDYKKMCAEQAVYIAATPLAFKDLAQMYEGLLKFGVEGAVNGTVAYGEEPGELAPAVKILADLLGLGYEDEKANFSSKWSAY